jgi:hypothetical protein
LRHVNGRPHRRQIFDSRSDGGRARLGRFGGMSPHQRTGVHACSVQSPVTEVLQARVGGIQVGFCGIVV